MSEPIGRRAVLQRDDLRSRRPAPPPRATRREPEAGHELLRLQRLAGNRAVVRMLERDLHVTAADHPFEREASHAERSLAPQAGVLRRSPGAPAVARAPSALATDPGVALTPQLRSRLEPTLGQLGAVRVHRGADADAMTEALGAEALTHGTDIFVSRTAGRPGTDGGDRLLAHEAAHATGQAAASGLVHLKRSKKHLDFIRIKKKSTHITRMLMSNALNALGAKDLATAVDTDDSGERIDHYGHWWIEVGKLATPGDTSSWVPAKSYGWWPAHSVNIAQTLKIERVEGQLNQGAADDPHHGEKAGTEYHPVLEVDDSAKYEDVRDRVVADLDAFATGFSGSWNWRLGWGKNCHTFVDRAKKKLKLHHQASKQWLSGAGVEAQAPKPAMKGFAQIRKILEVGQGFGYGAFGLIGNVQSVITVDELLALKPDERDELRNVLNEGLAPTDFNHLDKPTFTDRLVDTWNDDRLRGYLT